MTHLFTTIIVDVYFNSECELAGKCQSQETNFMSKKIRSHWKSSLMKSVTFKTSQARFVIGFISICAITISQSNMRRF